MEQALWVFLFIVTLVAERTLELVIARKHEAWIRSLGGKEYGFGFSRLIVLFHTAWFVSFAAEACLVKAVPLVAPRYLVLIFLLLQGGRYWCIVSLGRYWNTKILVLPGASVIREGPYRWLRHPNYVVVAIEVALYPVLFGCWMTALSFGVGNLWVLRKRIGQEEQALAENTDFCGKG